MMEPHRLAEDMLFLACTRPAMIAGVTMEAMAFNMIFSCILFLAAGSILYGLVALPIHGVNRIICRYDPNMFRILLAWLETRGRMRNASFWGGSSCTPLRLVKPYRAKDFAHA
ncbi:MAG: type IV secretion system protein VirB3 [Methylocystis sp.]|jgi:type IV secretion system protein VirB3